MKKISFVLMFISLISFGFAGEYIPEEDMYEYNNIVLNMKGPCAPYESGNYIVFTAPRTSRQQGIAFDFENYSTIHHYKIHKLTDFEGATTSSWMFFLLKKPAKVTSIKYRTIIDGLWTTDDTNPDTFTHQETGISFSCITIHNTDPVVTETVNDGYTKFVCFAETGKHIRLGGTFTNWDSWIYEMKEVAYGKYELSLPLPKGTYYYNYYEGMHAFTDDTNPSKGYTADGKIASCITVN